MSDRPPETEPCPYSLEPCPIIEASAKSGEHSSQVWTCMKCFVMWEMTSSGVVRSGVR